MLDKESGTSWLGNWELSYLQERAGPYPHGWALLSGQGISLCLLSILASGSHGVRILHYLLQGALGRLVAEHCRRGGDQPEAQSPVEGPLLQVHCCVSDSDWATSRAVPGRVRTVSLDMRYV